jgi:putative peptidoglycan lipid II flippase
MSLARSTMVQASFTMLSRLLGYARDRVISNVLGAGPIGDAFATAQMFPNLFRRIFAEGAFSQAFVPLYARAEREHGKQDAERVASESLSALAATTLIITIVAQIAMPWIMLVVHAGYRDQPHYFNFAIILTQITMPYLVGMSASALFAGVLNTAGRFAMSAAAPVMLNLCVLIAVLPQPTPEAGAMAGAIAIAVAGVVQALLLWWGCVRLGVRFQFKAPKLTPDVKRVLALAAPVAFAASATQVNVFVSQALASLEEGAKSWLYAADRLYQLPLGIIGVAIGVALLPRLARAVASKDAEEESRAIDEGVALSMAFTLPAAAALLVMPFFLMHGFWTGGKFTDADARATADALFQYGWGVPAFVLLRILAPPFFARQDTKRPMRFALVSVAVNVAVGAGLFFGLRATGHPGFVGLAVGTAAAAWVNVAQLGGTLLAEKLWRPSPKLIGQMLRIAVATAIMAAALGFMAYQREAIIAAFQRILPLRMGVKELAVTAVAGVGFAIYVAAAFITGALRASDIALAMRRPAGAPREGGGLPPGVGG